MVLLQFVTLTPGRVTGESLPLFYNLWYLASADTGHFLLFKMSISQATSCPILVSDVKDISLVARSRTQSKAIKSELEPGSSGERWTLYYGVSKDQFT